MLFAEPFAMPALILPFLLGVGQWISRAFFGKSKESHALLWAIATIPVFAFGYDSFAKTYLHENFGWKCDDCEMRLFFKDKIGNKDWIVNYELFKSGPKKPCQNRQKENNVNLADIQKYVTIVTKNIDWLQVQIHQKQLGSHLLDKDLLIQANNKIANASNYQRKHLARCWGGSSLHYLDKVEKLVKVQMQLYDQLVKGSDA